MKVKSCFFFLKKNALTQITVRRANNKRPFGLLRSFAQQEIRGGLLGVGNGTYEKVEKQRDMAE